MICFFVAIIGAENLRPSRPRIILSPLAGRLRKKFKNYPTPFSHKENAKDAFDKLFDKYKKSIILVSYSSNCLPTLDEMVEMLAKYKKDVKVLSIDYRYSFANQKENMSTNKNMVKEYLFLGF